MKTRILTAATVSAATVMTLVPGALAQPVQESTIGIAPATTVVTLPPTIPPIQPTPSLVPLPTLPPVVVTVPDMELCLNINIDLCPVDEIDDILLPPSSTTPTTTPGPDEEGIGDPTPPTVPEPEPPVEPEPEPETPAEPETPSEPETPTEPEPGANDDNNGDEDSDDSSGNSLGDIDAPRPGNPNFAG